MGLYEYSFEFYDVMMVLGQNDSSGTINSNQTYSFNIPNTPTNATEYNSWISWIDDRVMPTWAYINGDGMVLYNNIKRNVPANHQDLKDLIDPRDVIIAGIPAATQADWMATTGYQAILHRPNLATVATSGSYTDLTSKPTIPSAISIASVTRSLVTSTSATGFQVSSSRMSNVAYSIQIAATLNLTSGQSSTVTLETAATNSTTPGDWTVLKTVTNGNTGALTIGLNLVQTMVFDVSAYIPAGNYVRIRSNGTATCTYIGGQEALV